MTVNPSYESHEKQQLEIVWRLFAVNHRANTFVRLGSLSSKSPDATCCLVPWQQVSAIQIRWKQHKATLFVVCLEAFPTRLQQIVPCLALINFLSSARLQYNYSNTLPAACFSKATVGAPCTIHPTKDWLNKASQRMPSPTFSELTSHGDSHTIRQIFSNMATHLTIRQKSKRWCRCHETSHPTTLVLLECRESCDVTPGWDCKVDKAQLGCLTFAFRAS